MSTTTGIPNGVMLNAYPDSVGDNLSDIIRLLQRPECNDAFSLFYVLPTFFNSDLDRGFSIVDYDLNDLLVAPEDIETLEQLGIQLKCDIVLNHLSVGSPQFKDLLAHGDASKYANFFIDWNQYWKGHTTSYEDGVAIPEKEHLIKLFMRKPGLPVLKVPFPDGSVRPYWNTFYQKISYQEVTTQDFHHIKELSVADLEHVVSVINECIQLGGTMEEVRFRESVIPHKKTIQKIVSRKRTYLGQMDVNAASPLVWEFYEETLKKVSSYGCKILRLDAFAYLHKEIGQSNFFNSPGTWDHLQRIQDIAQRYDLTLLPEIHAEYGSGLHKAVASQGYPIYDFFFPGLIIHTLETGDNTALITWIDEIITQGYQTVNMLGCHDGIPVLDLKGALKDGQFHKGLLTDSEIEHVIETILNRGGRVKNIYDPDGNKISYYQVNATFFSALDEDEDKLLLARAVQLFMPGVPQVWYLDLFAGTNDYAAVTAAGDGGHKEINRTTLNAAAIEQGLKRKVVLKQLELLRLRNTSKVFLGTLRMESTSQSQLNMTWESDQEKMCLEANLENYTFMINHHTAEAIECIFKS